MKKIGQRTLLGFISIFFVTLSAISYQIVPSKSARIPILVVIPFVIWLASPDPVSSGGCKECKAKRKKQKYIFTKPEVTQSNKSSSLKGEVEVDLGWDVKINFRQICQKCNNESFGYKIFYVTKKTASTPTQAILFAKNYFMSDQ